MTCVLTDIADLILSEKSSDKPYLVAIDGKSCAGKTTFADNLGQTLNSKNKAIKIIRPSIDGFHNDRDTRYKQGAYSAKGYYEDTYNIPKIINGILCPLTSGKYPVQCQSVSFDFRQDIPSEEFIECDCDTIILFEGLFLMKPDLNRFWNKRLLLDISDQTSLDRALLRDGDLLGDEDTIRKKYNERYTPAWHLYESDVNPYETANIVINNETLETPSIIKNDT